MKRSIGEILKNAVRKGRNTKAFPNDIIFSILSPKASKSHFVNLRVGREIARKSGLRPGDRITLHLDVETGEGFLEPTKPGETGHILISGDEKVLDCPPVVLKLTWVEGYPSIQEKSPVDRVMITGSRALKFKFPEGTSFTTLAAEGNDGVGSELYEEHRGLVEGGKAKKPRRELKPIERRGACYGRRSTDRQNG